MLRRLEPMGYTRETLCLQQKLIVHEQKTHGELHCGQLKYCGTNAITTKDSGTKT